MQPDPTAAQVLAEIREVVRLALAVPAASPRIEPLLTVDEVADLFSVSPKTVRGWVETKRIPHYKPGAHADDKIRSKVGVRLDGEPITTLGGGLTDLHVPDEHIAPTCPLAPRLWTWARPGDAALSGVRLPAGKHHLVLENLTAGVRYDALLITDEPSFQPRDGRLRQR